MHSRTSENKSRRVSYVHHASVLLFSPMSCDRLICIHSLLAMMNWLRVK